MTTSTRSSSDDSFSAFPDYYADKSGADTGGADKGGSAAAQDTGTARPGSRRAGSRTTGTAFPARRPRTADRLSLRQLQRREQQRRAESGAPAGPRTRTARRGGPPGGGHGPRWWRERSRWFRRLVIVAIVMFFFLLAGGVGLVYALTKVPLPANVTLAQQSVITYAPTGNSAPRVIAKVGAQNRKVVKLSQISLDAQHAVLAAEDKRFYTEPGISYRGIARALWADVSGGEISQGGSTITQQYAKNAYLTQERTFTRKLREIAIAVKLDKKYSKNQILEYYLNTIYFGRGANGIEAASYAYFNIPASKLNAIQGAILGGLIRSPNYLDPVVSPQAAQRRYGEVIATMEDQKWLTPQQYAFVKNVNVSKYVLAKAPSSGGPGGDQIAYITAQVKRELVQHGISQSYLDTGGLTVTTTLDYGAQTKAYQAVTSTMAGAPDQVQRGFIALQPGTGRVLAWYGGQNFNQTYQYDSVSQAQIQPGSSFKPIVLATALAAGTPLSKTYNGASPLMGIPGYDAGVHNFTGSDGKDEQFGNIDLVDATAHSVNTVYVKLGQDVGEKTIVAMGKRLGITSLSESDAVPSLPLGTAPVTLNEMASAYATFAANGVQATPHLVSKVTDSNGKVIYNGDGANSVNTPRQVLSSDVVKDATYAMQHVLEGNNQPDGAGTAAGYALANGREAAGKTGTTTYNRSALFCGYTASAGTTPAVAACSALYVDPKRPLRGDPKNGLTNILGIGEVTGGTLPAKIWKSFMDADLANYPAAQFPPPTDPVYTQPAPQPTPQEQNPLPGVTLPPEIQKFLPTPSKSQGNGNGRGQGNGNAPTGNNPTPEGSQPAATGFASPAPSPEPPTVRTVPDG